jgi:hypothetical protein
VKVSFLLKHDKDYFNRLSLGERFRCLKLIDVARLWNSIIRQVLTKNYREGKSGCYTSEVLNSNGDVTCNVGLGRIGTVKPFAASHLGKRGEKIIE